MVMQLIQRVKTTFICLVNSINQFSSIGKTLPSQYLHIFQQLLQEKIRQKAIMGMS